MGSLAGGSNAILLLLIAMAIGVSLVIALVAASRGRRKVARTGLGAAGLLALAYGGGVLAVAAASREHTIDQGDTKWFCGFYLDCHLGLSIVRVDTTSTLPGPNALQADGDFHIVTLELHNSAKNPEIDMLLYEPDARIVDAAGREYERSAPAEAALARAGEPGALGDQTKVTHEPVEARIVFDLPTGVREPRLMVTEGWIVDRVIELGLIGDENSIFHKHTFMALSGISNRTASSIAR